MKKTILIITASLLFVAMFITPTIAMNPKNPKKIPVGFDRTGFSATPGDSWITKGETFHARGDVSEWGEDAYNIYDVDENGDFLKQQVVLEGGNYVMIGKTNVNLKNPGTEMEIPVEIAPGITIMVPVIIGTGSSILKVEIDFGDGNMFKGIMKSQGKLMLFPTGGVGCYEGLQKSVLHGTGDYQGWTLIWEREYDGNPTPLRWDAYMLIP